MVLRSCSPDRIYGARWRWWAPACIEVDKAAVEAGGWRRRSAHWHWGWRRWRAVHARVWRHRAIEARRRRRRSPSAAHHYYGRPRVRGSVASSVVAPARGVAVFMVMRLLPTRSLGEGPAKEVSGEANAGVGVAVNAAGHGASDTALVTQAAVDGLVVQLVHERHAVRC